MIEIEHNEATDTYDASASVYECGWCTRREALEDFRDKLEIMMIKCNEMLQQGEE